MLHRSVLFIPILLVTGLLLRAESAPAIPAGWNDIAVVLEESCYHCHGPEDPEANLNLEALHGDPALFAQYEIWTKVEHAIASGEMPPKKKLPPHAKTQLTTWLHGELDKVARANAGDPGLVTVRRLTNVEYDNTIRALTGGLDLNLSADFLPDGGGGEGFSNVGDVLFVSPQQLDKYLSAARKLADQATILPGTGVRFQPTRVGMRGPEQLRDQAEQALYVWYQKMSAEHLPKDGDDLLEDDYLLAAWRHKHQDLTGASSLPELAKQNNLNPIFLQNWWNMLNTPTPQSRFLDLTRHAWRDLPPPDPANPKEIPDSVRKAVTTIQTNDRSWRDDRRVQRRQQDSDGIRPYPFSADTHGKSQVTIVLGQLDDGNRGDHVLFSNLTLIRGKNKKREAYQPWLQRRLETDRQALQKATTENNQSAIDSLKKRITQAETLLAKFGKHTVPGKTTEPTALYLQAPIALSLPLPEDNLRFEARGQLDLRHPDADFASTQWLATTGPVPDPNKIIPGELIIWKRSTPAHNLIMKEFSVMKQAFPDEYNRRLEEITRNPNRNPDNPPGKNFYPGVYYFSDTQLKSILPPAEQENFLRMQTDRRLTRRTKLDPKDAIEWDTSVQRHLHYFASLAWRRPITDGEKSHVTTLYTEALKRDLDRESAAREVVVRLLIAPDFIFKLEGSTKPGEHPITGPELATRLAYFLWSSPPDHQLRKAGADGSLLKPEVLESETRRLLKDRRAANLAREFAGQWLQFHAFDKNTTPDPTKFPEFTGDLRRDMYRETTEFFTHLIREDRPVTDILLADYTFLNERLAKHYNIPNITGSEFRKVSVSNHQRGGVLGMGSLLTKTSFPQRTSPVLRGDWLLHAILGTPTPPPPADVPQLDDSASKATTLRAKLEAHRAAAACASCHDKIDPLGFALEAYDPIGRLRTNDESGVPIDNRATTADGTDLDGMDSLKKYLGTRNAQFQTLLSRKLIGYSLGRSVQPTDKVLIETMVKSMNQNDTRFPSAVLTLVTSRQFQNRRNE
ncbi:DUF1592 domain-containing protein [Phragmitibacter flavus]|uniref:DUF1592 domain-containing protein n=1 Tax=Phragmitibacter flavus TaxID=2576071 RepID=A0A5R8KB90_9BACT|nr:DUF1592 domain-containing protein [Phragmitibacter flavus]TLD69561.1 DUF1592 domain-containing protein [Phragmitibacter flavus]